MPILQFDTGQPQRQLSRPVELFLRQHQVLAVQFEASPRSAVG